MKNLRKYLLYFLPTVLIIGTVVLSVLFGTHILQLKADAAAPNGEDVSSLIGHPAWMHEPIRPLFNEAVNMANTANLPACLTSTAGPSCYSPKQVRQAYGVQPLLDQGITGKNQTITLVELFANPKIQDELHSFDKAFGLSDPKLTVAAPLGPPLVNPANPFDAETALDVEWAHVLAPDADIQVLQMPTANAQSFGDVVARTLQFAVKQQNTSDILSLSFGTSEQCFGSQFIQQTHAAFQQARANKQTVLVASGDTGSAMFQCDAKGNIVGTAKGVSYPASDPLVTAIGGTTLAAGKDGTYKAETTWNEVDTGHGATGGGISTVFPKPDFQQNLPIAKRGAADVSFDGDPLTGVPVAVHSQPDDLDMIPVGGTSLGAPAVAGMAALFNQANKGRLGFLNPAIYRISQDKTAYAQSFHDITTGENTFVTKDQKTGKISLVSGFKAATGWDAPTGVGSPIATKLAASLPQFIKPDDGKGL